MGDPAARDWYEVWSDLPAGDICTGSWDELEWETSDKLDADAFVLPGNLFCSW